MARSAGDEADDRLAEEAAGWVARLQSADATDQDRRAFALWLQRDPAHQPAYDDFKVLWAELKDVPIPSGRLKKLKASRRAAVGNVLALGVIAVLGTALYRMGFVDRLRADHYTAVGEIRSVTLADGSRVDLNTDTAIIVRYTPEERRIDLIRGEAFFDVAANAQRPFVVHGGALDAMALGTRYAVQGPSAAAPAGVQVESGRVGVTGAGGRVVLGAGEAARLGDQGRLVVTRADTASSTAWRGGKLVFSGEPLRQVLATLELYRHGRIIVLDAAAAEQRVSGIFDLNDTDQALQVLEDSLPVAVTRLTGMMVVVRSR